MWLLICLCLELQTDFSCTPSLNSLFWLLPVPVGNNCKFILEYCGKRFYNQSAASSMGTGEGSSIKKSVYLLTLHNVLKQYCTVAVHGWNSVPDMFYIVCTNIKKFKDLIHTCIHIHLYMDFYILLKNWKI